MQVMCGLRLSCFVNDHMLLYVSLCLLNQHSMDSDDIHTRTMILGDTQASLNRFYTPANGKPGLISEQIVLRISQRADRALR